MPHLERVLPKADFVVVATPHVSCDDPRYMDILLDSWFGNFERFLAGKPLRNQVDRKLGY